MREFWLWWKVRTTQIKALLMLGMILMWMSLDLWQTQRSLGTVMAAHEQLVKQLDKTRQLQIDALVQAIQIHQAQEDVDAASLSDELREIRLMIGQLITQTRK
jgi:hypothetical protein